MSPKLSETASNEVEWNLCESKQQQETQEDEPNRAICNKAIRAAARGDSADCGVLFEWNACEGMVQGEKAINEDILLLG